MGSVSKKIGKHPVTVRGDVDPDRVAGAARILLGITPAERRTRRMAKALVRKDLKRIVKKNADDWTEFEAGLVKTFARSILGANQCLGTVTLPVQLGQPTADKTPSWLSTGEESESSSSADKDDSNPLVKPSASQKKL